MKTRDACWLSGSRHPLRNPETFLCDKSRVDFANARKLLMSMTFARRTRFYRATTSVSRATDDPKSGVDFVNARKLRRDPSLRFVARDADPDRIGAFRGGLIMGCLPPEYRIANKKP